MKQIKNVIMSFFKKSCVEEIPCISGLGKVSWVVVEGKRLSLEEFRQLNISNQSDQAKRL